MKETDYTMMIMETYGINERATDRETVREVFHDDVITSKVKQLS